LEKENKKAGELIASQNERMNALRGINKQLEQRSEDIKQKCSELSYLKRYCAELETKCKQQEKLLQLAQITQTNAPNNKDEELIQKYINI